MVTTIAAMEHSSARDMLLPYIEYVAVTLEALGILIIVVGAIYALFIFGRGLAHRHDPYHELRRTLGRSILLGLEFLIAADIVGTVIVDPTLYNAGVLATIVGIRTFLSWSLEVEINGHWPWQGQKRGEQ